MLGVKIARINSQWLFPVCCFLPFAITAKRSLLLFFFLSSYPPSFSMNRKTSKPPLFLLLRIRGRTAILPASPIITLINQAGLNFPPPPTYLPPQLFNYLLSTTLSPTMERRAPSPRRQRWGADFGTAQPHQQ